MTPSKILIPESGPIILLPDFTLEEPDIKCNDDHICEGCQEELNEYESSLSEAIKKGVEFEDQEEVIDFLETNHEKYLYNNKGIIPGTYTIDRSVILVDQYKRHDGTWHDDPIPTRGYGFERRQVARFKKED